MQETVRTPRVVEKRIPVTYTYNVPHVVCYRVPLDACGNPIIETVSLRRPLSRAADLSPDPRSDERHAVDLRQERRRRRQPKKPAEGDRAEPLLRWAIRNDAHLRTKHRKAADEKAECALRTIDPTDIRPPKKRPVVRRFRPKLEEANTEPSRGLESWRSQAIAPEIRLQ